MPPPTAVVLGSDAEVADVGAAVLARGNAVDAVVASVFAAAGLYASVLFGPVQLLIGGAGAGLRAVDGRTLQPGLGNPRPRGFLRSQPVPPAARVAVPALPAALLAAVTTYGRLSVAAVLAPGVELARSRSPLRADLLVRIAQRGPAALAEARVADELTAAAGRLAGGILSQRDLADLRPTVAGAAAHAAGVGRDVMTVPWGAGAVCEADAPSPSGVDTRVVVAVDRNGLVAVACYEVPREGLSLDAFDVVAPFTAAPVLRGEPRVKPGVPRPAAAPIALAQLSGVVELAVGVGASVDSEAILGAWLATYRPASDLEREAPLPRGLAAVQRAGAGWAALSGPPA
jgi:gamma-glutamyltranspeptidase/glutathione hydrolase